MEMFEKAILATQQFDNKQIDIQEWVRVVIGEDYYNVYSDEYARRAEKFFSIFANRLQFNHSDGNDKDEINNDVISALEQAKKELEKEKIKVATENLEYRANQRNEARDELFMERITDAISRLPKFEPKPYQVVKDYPYDALLVVADIHAGADFEVKGFNGEIVNKYSFEIMQERMWKIYNEIIDEGYETLTIAFLGDMVENILRMSSLTKLKEPVMDTVIKLGEFLSVWVNAIQEKIDKPVNVVIVGGNHDCQRLLTQKPMFEGENFAKIIREFMYLRLKDNECITVDDYTDTAIKTIRMNNVMFCHGEDRDLSKTMQYFSNLYGVGIDECYAGHLHSKETKTCGITDVGDMTVYRVGSIMGIDPYAKSIRVGARPSCHFAMYNENGKSWSRDIYM